MYIAVDFSPPMTPLVDMAEPIKYIKDNSEKVAYY